MATPLQTLKTIHAQLNDLSTAEPQAQLLMQFFEEAIVLLDAFHKPEHELFELQKRTLLKGLHGQLAQYRQAYRQGSDRVEKINGFLNARGQLHLLLGRVLVTCQLRNESNRRQHFWAFLHV